MPAVSMPGQDCRDKRDPESQRVGGEDRKMGGKSARQMPFDLVKTRLGWRNKLHTIKKLAGGPAEQ